MRNDYRMCVKCSTMAKERAIAAVKEREKRGELTFNALRKNRKWPLARSGFAVVFACRLSYAKHSTLKCISSGTPMDAPWLAASLSPLLKPSLSGAPGFVSFRWPMPTGGQVPGHRWVTASQVMSEGRRQRGLFGFSLLLCPLLGHFFRRVF